MPRFLTGDELGNIKSLRYLPGNHPDSNKTECKTLYAGTAGEASKSVQALAVAPSDGSSRPELVAAGFSDGTGSAFSLEGDVLEEAQHWKETRLKDQQRYIGLTVSEKGIFSCTSNGALRLTPFRDQDEPVAPILSALPTRLCDWRMSIDQHTFAYGGDEVDLSVWNTETAFLPPPEEVKIGGAVSKKRKRNDGLFSGELWRAKNVPNDSLGLRQPIRITSLTYLSPSSATHHILTGTQLGDIRRYDTRAARRPVSDWRLNKAGGIKVVEKGISEHEVFVSDYGSNLFALDLRNGRVVYGYKGISGAVTSIAPSPSILASTALDRFARIHSTFSPPPQAGQHSERKGEVLDKVFMKSIPTTVVWDQNTDKRGVVDPEDNIWEDMVPVNDNTDT